MSTQEAMEGYLKLVELLDPGWETGQLDRSQMVGGVTTTVVPLSAG